MVKNNDVSVYCYGGTVVIGISLVVLKNIGGEVVFRWGWIWVVGLGCAGMTVPPATLPL